MKLELYHMFRATFLRPLAYKSINLVYNIGDSWPSFDKTIFSRWRSCKNKFDMELFLTIQKLNYVDFLMGKLQEDSLWGDMANLVVNLFRCQEQWLRNGVHWTVIEAPRCRSFYPLGVSIFSQTSISQWRAWIVGASRQQVPKKKIL